MVNDQATPVSITNTELLPASAMATPYVISPAGSDFSKIANNLKIVNVTKAVEVEEKTLK